MTRYFGAHVDDAGIALESSGGLLLLGMIIMSLSIISMVIFACGDDQRRSWGVAGRGHRPPRSFEKKKLTRKVSGSVPGDDNSGTPPHNGCRNPPLLAPPPGPDEVGVGDLSSVPGPDEIGEGGGGGGGGGRLDLGRYHRGLRGQEVGLGSGMCDAVTNDDHDTGI